MNVKALRVVNVFLILNFLVQAATGLLRDWMPYGVFSAIHKPSGYLLVFLILTHVYLNRNWLMQNYFKKKKPVR